MNIKSILVANRGEIAIRVAHTAHKLGIRIYCIQTNKEANALYLDSADQIIAVEDNEAKSIFLNIDSLIEIALENNIDAIHPGYGFLAESAEFAQACKDNGILFIGPSVDAINKMGNKDLAKKIAAEAGIPVLEGSTSSVNNLEDTRMWCNKIGYPVILKAVAGGGGKGMRVVYNNEELDSLYKLVVNEAQNAFDNSEILIEKFVVNPKHIEVQVLGDNHSNAVHLFERECSIQRKHQKLLEEAPSMALSPELRAEMGRVSVQLCLAVGYATLGTVEYLVDESGDYYFLEMNTRVQVEHPVTEHITGLDLIELQIRTACGEKLELKQEDISLNGWAIELRINAEDVQMDFTPSLGVIDVMEFPENNSLRVDKAYIAGKTVTPFYDSLIAKLIISGKDRESTIKRALRILEGTKIKGVKTTIPFFKSLLRNKKFRSGDFNTSFISSMESIFYQEADEEKAAAMVALQAYLLEKQNVASADDIDEDNSAWAERIHNKLF